MTKDKRGGNKGRHTDTSEGKIGVVIGVFVDFICSRSESCPDGRFKNKKSSPSLRVSIYPDTEIPPHFPLKTFFVC